MNKVPGQKYKPEVQAVFVVLDFCDPFIQITWRNLFRMSRNRLARHLSIYQTAKFVLQTSE